MVMHGMGHHPLTWILLPATGALLSIASDQSREMVQLLPSPWNPFGSSGSSRPTALDYPALRPTRRNCLRRLNDEGLAKLLSSHSRTPTPFEPDLPRTGMNRDHLVDALVEVRSLTLEKILDVMTPQELMRVCSEQEIQFVSEKKVDLLDLMLQGRHDLKPDEDALIDEYVNRLRNTDVDQLFHERKKVRFARERDAARQRNLVWAEWTVGGALLSAIFGVFITDVVHLRVLMAIAGGLGTFFILYGQLNRYWGAFMHGALQSVVMLVGLLFGWLNMGGWGLLVASLFLSAFGMFIGRTQEGVELNPDISPLL
jgi:hypothetical protein